MLPSIYESITLRIKLKNIHLIFILQLRILKTFEISFSFTGTGCYAVRINSDFANWIILIAIKLLRKEISSNIFFHYSFENIVLLAETLQIFEAENIFNISLY